jgi:hypothetical protein
MENHDGAPQFQGWRLRGLPPIVRGLMTVYDGAVRIQGKDGRDLRPWRVAVYRAGVVAGFATVPAHTGAEATRVARRRWPDGTVLAF